MRKIEFRAISINKKFQFGKWIHGGCAFSSTGKAYITDGHTKIRVNPLTFSQYTGLIDCYGNKIFEGDILHIDCFGNKIFEGDILHIDCFGNKIFEGDILQYKDYGELKTATVVFRYGAFQVKIFDYYQLLNSFLHDFFCHVIGNIFEEANNEQIT